MFRVKSISTKRCSSHLFLNPINKHINTNNNDNKNGIKGQSEDKMKASQRTKVERRNSEYDMEKEVRNIGARLMRIALKEVYGTQIDESAFANAVKEKMGQSKHGRGQISVPCFVLAKHCSSPPSLVADKLAESINSQLRSQSNVDHPIQKVDSCGGYINMHLSTEYLGGIIGKILNKEDGYLDQLPKTKARVMVEYSQPNTHKAFHVGHMRNVALGDCLVRLYEHIGNEVIAANYFGDEGSHVASCLWLLQKKMSEQDVTLEELVCESMTKGEWLGTTYAESKRWLDLATYTHLPFKGVVVAKVLSMSEMHPGVDASRNYRVITLDYGLARHATVVCTGDGFRVNDLVSYVPVGTHFQGKVVEPRHFKGLVSHGILLSARELGIDPS
ncbi:hypothetical protein RFI_14621, partial [Reticulomyxa filosa]